MHVTCLIVGSGVEGKIFWAKSRNLRFKSDHLNDEGIRLPLTYNIRKKTGVIKKKKTSVDYNSILPINLY